MSTNSNTSKFERALAYVIVVLAVVAMWLSYNHSFTLVYAMGPSRNERECASPKFIDGRIQYEVVTTTEGDMGVRLAGCPDVEEEEDNMLASLTEWVIVTLTSTPDSTSTQVVTSTPVVVVTSTPIITTTSVPTLTPTVVVTSTPNPTDTPMPTETDKPHCNKGEGNGGEGCDPGNHPEKGNDDEDEG